MSQLLRILLVEDSEDDAELIVLELERGDYQPIYERIDTAAALQAALDRQTWDVIVCDYSMPHFSAPEALAILQARNLDLPFIIVSGTIGEDIAVTAMKAGAHDYLIKGNLTRLVPAIARELREAQDRQSRRQAEQALRESEERFRSLIENSLDIVAVLALDGTMQYGSPSIEAVLGYLPSELTHRNLFDYIHPNDTARVQQAFQQAIARPDLRAWVEFRFQHRDDNWRILEASGKHFNDPDGFARVIVNARDITERKQAEAMRQALEQEKELSELRVRFYSMMSHEFRSPLTVIQMTTQLLRDYSGALPQDRRQEFFQRILAATKRMVYLLEDVLVIGKAEAGKFEPKSTALDLEAFCRDLIEETQLTVGRDHDLKLRVQGDRSDTFLDADMLHHVLSNLLTNAIKYSAAGTTIDVDLHYQSHQAVIQVRDRGIGIPAEDQPQTFSSFQRASNVGQVSGTGLGLAIAKKFVEIQGGTISFTSTENIGTTFTVTLPLDPGA